MAPRVVSIVLLLVVMSCSATSHEVLDAGPTDLAVDPADLAITDAARDLAVADDGPTCDARVWTVLDELHAISRCTADSDCGQDLRDACGCTRDRVVRNDADPSHLVDLVHELQAMCPSTPPPVFGGGPCDCPAADGIVCANGICAWNFLGADCIYDGHPHRVGEMFFAVDGDGSWCRCNASTDPGPAGGVTCLI